MLNYLTKVRVFKSRLSHTRPLSECTISYSNLDFAVLEYRIAFQVNVSKIVMNFKTGASMSAIVNLASHKSNQLFASCDEKSGNLKLKFE